MEITLDRDEWYPVLTFDTKDDWNMSDKFIEVNPDTISRWEKVFEDFDKVQGELRDLWKANYAKTN